MITYHHDNIIQCEVCNALFPRYPEHNGSIDTDGFDKAAKGVEEGLCNRITCSHCGSEFTFENPTLFYSWKYKMYAASYFKDGSYCASNLKNALRISGAEDVSLRKTHFAIEAVEKIHIAKHGLCDVKTELFKIVRFPKYKNMKADEETIIFDKIENDNLIFSHRHFTDTIISKFKVPVSEYEAFECNLPEAPKGEWLKIDKEWILAHMEDEI